MTRVLIVNAETQSLADRLLSRFPDCDVTQVNDLTEVPAALSRHRPEVVYAVRFTSAVPFPRDALLGADGPAWIANGGVGTDHLAPWDTDLRTVTNAAGVASEMMAEYILGGFLHFGLDMPGLMADQSARTWDPMRRVTPLKGRTLLIIGLGHTGRALAARAKAFGMRVIGTRARPQDTPHVDEVFAAADLHRALPLADDIAICTPLIAQTRGLIDAEALGAMKPGVRLADVSRGGVVDQTALAAALTSGQVSVAVLDVFETEPLPSESPLWGLPNVLVSPHCSSVFEGWEAASFEVFLDNLARWRSGAPLVNVVEPARGY